MRFERPQHANQKPPLRRFRVYEYKTRYHKDGEMSQLFYKLIERI